MACCTAAPIPAARPTSWAGSRSGYARKKCNLATENTENTEENQKNINAKDSLQYPLEGYAKEKTEFAT